MIDFESIITNFQIKGVAISESETQEFCKLFKRSFIKKRQFIVQLGFVNKSRTYFVKGTFRGYVVDNEGHEH